MRRLKGLLVACVLAFAIVPVFASPAQACASVECRVNCIKGALEGNLVCAA
ncbi:MAG: hypothetical protein M3323_01480 [Actinomycetota bacterium]|nr:hypothetical protein [Actinomycetota bacterium]